MTTHAVRLAPVPCARAIAAKDIHLVRDRLKMARVDANTVPAEMINDLVIIDLTAVQTVRFPMGETVLADRSVGVAVCFERRAKPGPALVRTSYLYQSQKVVQAHYE
jgi:hypothetical protein